MRNLLAAVGLANRPNPTRPRHRHGYNVWTVFARDLHPGTVLADGATVTHVAPARRGSVIVVTDRGRRRVRVDARLPLRMPF
jgi:hypothetical protein